MLQTVMIHVLALCELGCAVCKVSLGCWTCRVNNVSVIGCRLRVYAEREIIEESQRRVERRSKESTGRSSEIPRVGLATAAHQVSHRLTTQVLIFVHIHWLAVDVDAFC